MWTSFTTLMVLTLITIYFIVKIIQNFVTDQTGYTDQQQSVERIRTNRSNDQINQINQNEQTNQTKKPPLTYRQILLGKLLKTKCSPKNDYNKLSIEDDNAIAVKIFYGGMNETEIVVTKNCKVHKIVEMFFSETVPLDRVKIKLLFKGKFVDENKAINELVEMSEKLTGLRNTKKLVFHAVVRSRRESRRKNSCQSFDLKTFLSLFLIVCCFSVFLVILWFYKNSNSSLVLPVKAELIFMFLAVVSFFVMTGLILTMAGIIV